jgi:UDP-N-acetylmuramate dehydrogenase
MDTFSVLKQDLPGVRERVPLKNHTTFHIGGPARYFFVARTKEDIQKAVRAANKHRVRFFVLSGGSNVVVSDKGFPGLVIKIQNGKYKIQDTRLWAEAGVEVSTLVEETTKRGLAGLEWAGGLPGTIGGATRGNAGAFAGEIKDSLVEAEAADENGETKTFSKRECRFGYRNSVFKEKGLIVLAATFALQKGDKKVLQAVAEEHIRYRKERHPLEYPNAGSVFKNCDVKKIPKTLQQELKDKIKLDPFPVLPTAVLIAKAELQGLRVGGAEVSEKHPNYIVNIGDATAKDVVLLIKKVKQKIKNRFGVHLYEEISFPP